MNSEGTSENHGRWCDRWRAQLRLGLLLVVAGWSAGWPLARAVPVGLRAVEASVADQDFPLSAAVDGIATTNNGWRVSGAVFQEQFAVFVPDQPLSAALCQFQFSFLSGLPNAHFGDFEIDVTTDENPAVQGRWAPLIPESAVADCADGVRAFGTTTRIETHCPVTVVTLRARVPFTGITGFRLRLFPNAPDPLGKRRSAIGRAPAGDFILTEFRVETDPQRSSNIALGRQPYCSRAVAAGLPSRNLTDGFFSTYSHPGSGGGRSEFFELDLGQMTALDHITLRGREDGPAEQQLAAHRLELLTEAGGFAGQTQWQSRPSIGAAPLLQGHAEVIRAADGEGGFAGRRLRIYNASQQDLQPVLAELEVYPALRPQAQDWLADDRVLERGAEVLVPAQAKELRFTIRCEQGEKVVGAVNYRWRLSGWNNEWRETGSDGRVVLAPLPDIGFFRMEVQARHSDGIWDESGIAVALRVVLPWWRNPTLTTLLAFVGVLLVIATWWRIKASVIKRRLALAEQHLSLQRERLRIARDMHDEMGARLTYIALLADRTRREANGQSPEQADQLAELADSARSSVTALDAIVWAVNPQHDSVGDLADYLSDYAPGYLKAAGIECRLDLHLENPKQTLSLSLRHALLMAVKEALQNVLRHAEARAVRVKLREAQGQLEVTVTDDGRGLDQPAAGVSHSGLENMRQRLAEIGGVCQISPGENGRGVCVRFTMPVTSTK